MTVFIYDLVLLVIRGLYAIASVVHPKAKSFRQGRSLQKTLLRETFPLPTHDPVIWFHCASLGEFEQGRPVIEALKASRPDVRILLTFFSPSGFEVRKTYPLADHVFYLPWDTRRNAAWFAQQVRPALAVFVKYEFWYHYSQALRKQHIPLISISAIFRRSHAYFKPHGIVFRKILKNFTWFFVQNEESLRLLHTIGIHDASVAGDTRFDRVAEVAGQAAGNETARSFKTGRKLLVIGSAWPEDMRVLYPFMNAKRDELKFIVAPHEMDEDLINSIAKNFSGSTVRYTHTSPADAAKADLLIVDTIGLLAQLYRYGEYAFVGGGFKQGLHNTLEAACYGIPIFFGGTVPYSPFQEAVDLVEKGGAFAVTDTNELTAVYDRLTGNPEAYRHAADCCRGYVEKNKGATRLITEYLLKTLGAWKAG